MEVNYPDIEERLLKKEKRDYLTEFIIPITLGAIFFTFLYVLSKAQCVEENMILTKQNETYEKILKYEYDRTFETFEEYIVYRADKIIGE